MDVLLTVDCVAVALFAGFCLVEVIPACNRSMFRFRLWKLRDELVDEIRAGAFHNGDRARELVQLTEDVIVRAADVSAGRLLLLHAAARGRLHYLVQATISLEGLNDHDVILLTERLRSLEWVMRRQVLLGSPVGWALLITLVPLSLLAAVVSYVFDRSGSVIEKAKALLRKEIDPRATLLDRHRPSTLVTERELSQMV